MHHKIQYHCIARVFYPHLYFPGSCCSQYLTLQSKSNLLGTYQNRCSSVCISFHPVLFLGYLKPQFYSTPLDVIFPSVSFITTPVPFLDVVYFYSSAIPGCLSIFTPVPFLECLSLCHSSAIPGCLSL